MLILSTTIFYRILLIAAISTGTLSGCFYRPNVHTLFLPKSQAFFNTNPPGCETLQPMVGPKMNAMSLPSISLAKIAEDTNHYGSRLAFSPDGHWLAVVNPAGALYLWRDLVSWQSYSYPGELLDQTFFNTASDRVLVAPHVFQIKEQQWLSLPAITTALTAGLAEEEPPGSFAAYASAWSPDGQELVVYTEYRASRRSGDRSSWSGPSKRLLLLDGQTRQLKTSLWEGQGREAYRAIALNDRLIAAGAVHLRIWDRQSQQMLAELSEHTLAIRALQWNPSGTLLASAGADQHIILWNTSSWQLRQRWKAHEGEIKAIAFHPKHPLFITGGDDQQIKIWSLEGKLLKTETVGGIVEGLALNAEGDRLAIAQGGPQARIIVYQVTVE